MYHKRKAEALQGKKLPETLRGNPITFTRIAQDALEYSKAHKRSAGDDKERMELLLDWFGDTAADSLTPHQIEHKLAAAASERKWKPATVNRYKALLSLTYRIAWENGKVQSNPVRLVRRLREDNAVIRYLKKDEETKLRAQVEPAHPERWAGIIFALNTGLRAGEQSGLRWKDIHLEHNPPQLRLALTKNGSPRYIPLNAPALQALRTVREFSVGSGFVFPQQPYRMWFEIALKAAGIEGFTWHCLRHTFASRLVMAGVDIRTVAELMGHKSLQMTMRYAHLAPEHKAAAVAKLESLEATDTKTSTTVQLPQKKKIFVFPQVPTVQQLAVKTGP
jgi:integrase